MAKNTAAAAPTKSYAKPKEAAKVEEPRLPVFKISIARRSQNGLKFDAQKEVNDLGEALGLAETAFQQANVREVIIIAK